MTEPALGHILRTLDPDAQGWVVAKLQSALIGAGFAVVADCVLELSTDLVMQQFQQAGGIKPVAILGPETWAALLP